MSFDLDDTIAAIASASGGAARGIVRISGNQALACVLPSFLTNDSSSLVSDMKDPQVVSGSFRISGEQSVPVDALIWPDSRSYTRQPTVEIHTLGIRPFLEELLQQFCREGARLAEPGEFTLRAFLAGRLDLTQAEAVLGVIDAKGNEELHHALGQLAGGLSRPLSDLRERLIGILAELEAGLDFVEEDIEFISQETLREYLLGATRSMQSIRKQMTSRSADLERPRIVLVGLPNSGKSSLFNALRQLGPTDPTEAPAIVSPQAGTTRDYLVANVAFGGIECELVDTAGEESLAEGQSIHNSAQDMTDFQSKQATLLLRCQECTEPHGSLSLGTNEILIHTKADLTPQQDHSEHVRFLCSSLTQQGVEELRAEVGRRVSLIQGSQGTVVASTVARCHESLAKAEESLAHAIDLVESGSGDELVAGELRFALHELGRVVGTVYTDDILDRVFGQFCIGK